MSLRGYTELYAVLRHNLRERSRSITPICKRSFTYPLSYAFSLYDKIPVQNLLFHADRLHITLLSLILCSEILSCGGSTGTRVKEPDEQARCQIHLEKTLRCQKEEKEKTGYTSFDPYHPCDKLKSVKFLTVSVKNTTSREGKLADHV